MVESKAKITVAATGNKRENISAEDIYQALNDITEHFKVNASGYYEAHLKSNRGNSRDAV